MCQEKLATVTFLYTMHKTPVYPPGIKECGIRFYYKSSKANKEQINKIHHIELRATMGHKATTPNVQHNQHKNRDHEG
jgi:hypothetical protein